jgi:lipoprotein-releasing system permease protein
LDYRLLIARRYLVSRKRVTLISVITGISTVGVMLGVAALIVVLSVMNGFYDFVRDLLVSLDPHVRIVSAEERSLSGADSVQAVALELQDVVSAAAYVEGKALLIHTASGDANKVVIVRGVIPETLAGVSDVVERTGLGEFNLERREGTPGIVVGAQLGRRLALMPGAGTLPSSEVGLLSAQAIERSITDPFGGARPTRFAVRGLYELEDLYDENHVFVSVEEAQRLFRLGNQVTGVELRLHDIDRASRVQRQLRSRLGPEYEVLTWYDLQRALYDVMRLEKWGASVILFLIIIVAAFNIVGSLTMVVIEKRRDIGVLRAMGVNKRNIQRIFLMEGLMIGAVGSLLGTAIGVGLTLLQKQYGLVQLRGAESFMIDAYPVAIRLTDVIGIAGISLILCVIAAWYPARRAAAIESARAVQVDG